MKHSNSIKVCHRGWTGQQIESFAIWHTIGLYIYDENGYEVAHEALNEPITEKAIREQIEYYQEKYQNV